jgi:hypothetical protein
MNPEPGTKYKFEYVGGRPYDPDVYTANGVLLKTVQIDGREYFLVAEKITSKPDNFFYLYYLSKTQLQKAMGPNKDQEFADLFKVVENPEFAHPKYFSSSLTPKILLMRPDIERLSGREAARKKIENFMTQVIYAPPIRNANEKVLFTGGPMYKRGFASFHKKGGKTRYRHKKYRNKTRKH